MNKKKDKAFPFRVGFTFVVVILDFLVLPQILIIPLLIKQQSLAAFHFSLFGGIKALPGVFHVWAWLQPLAAGAVVWIWVTGRSLVNVNYDSALPRAAGHGQHGTSRWLSDAEVDRYFSAHKLNTDQGEGR